MGKKILFSILALTTLIFLFVNRAKPSFEAQKQKTKEDFNCLREWEIRNQIVKSLSSGKKIIVGPKLIRMLFHDSIDRNNLIDKHGSRATYENGTTILGGVDFCLYTGLQDMPSNGSDTVDILADNPDGNPNHNRGLKPAKLLVTSIHDKFNGIISLPDMLVLAAFTSLEHFFTKKESYEFKYGRESGICSMVLCHKEACENSQTHFLETEPHNTFNSTENINFFKKLGFNVEETVALMGAHSIGGVNVCTGFEVIRKGDFCNEEYTNKDLRPGAYFDKTPGTLDSEFFKELEEAGTRPPICDNISKENICNANNRWCLKTVSNIIPEGKESLRNLVDVSHYLQSRRISLLASDYSIVTHNDTYTYVQQFASDERLFLNRFKAAYEKVANTVHANINLKTCPVVDCKKGKNGFMCENIVFQFDQAECNPDVAFLASENCKLIGSRGKTAKISCGNTMYFCNE